MDDELNIIYEVDLYGNTSYWLNKDTYEKIKDALLKEDIRVGVVEFNSLCGAEIVLPLNAIEGITFTTREQRAEGRRQNRAYKAEQEEDKQKEWE